MAFSTFVKNELAHQELKSKCCQLAELLALVRTDGSLHITKMGHALHTNSENAAVVRRTLKFFSDLFSLKSEVGVRKTTPQKINNYVIFFEPQNELNKAFRELGILGKNKHLSYGLPQRLIKKKCCAVSFLRGAFLGSGFISDPQKTSYHFEIAVNNEEVALRLVSLLSRFGFNARINFRRQGRAEKESYAVYLKESSKIAELLALLGAHDTLFKWENARIVKELKMETNRLVNCDMANLEKTVRAALSQIDEIALIDEEVGLGNLPRSLREIARARMSHPRISLKELGEVFEPHLSKSAVYHRLRRLSQLAGSLRKQILAAS